MNERETSAVLAMLSAAWPNHELTKPTIALWARHLQHTVPADAMAAADLIVKTDEWFPSIARFMETVRARARSRVGHSQTAAIGAGDDPPLEGDDAKAALEKVRAAVAAAPKPPKIDGLASIGDGLGEERR